MNSMNLFLQATKLGAQRYHRNHLLATASALIRCFHLSVEQQDRGMMRSACGHLANALDGCSGSTLQQRWNDFEKKVWPQWKAGIGRPGTLWTWGARVLVPTRIIVPTLEWLAEVRVNQWIARLPEEHPLAQQHGLLLRATGAINWASALNRHRAVANGLRLLLACGYDNLRHIKEEDQKLLSGRWSKGTDVLDGALCLLGVFSRTPQRGCARHHRRRRRTVAELVEIAKIPARFRQVTILYLEAYEVRVSHVYRTLRHKCMALAHFWRFIKEHQPAVKCCSEILPRHVRDYIPHILARARALQRGPGAGEEVRSSAHSWLIDLRTFFSDLCSWATEPDSPLAGFAPRTIPATRHTFRGYGFEKARQRTSARITQRFSTWNARCPRFVPWPGSDGKSLSPHR